MTPITVDSTRLASHLEHTLLRPEAGRADIERACRVAMELGCAAICTNPIWVALAKQLLKDSTVKVVAVIGFPFGATYTAVKEARSPSATMAAVGDATVTIGLLAGVDLQCDRFSAVGAVWQTRIRRFRSV